MRFLLSRREAGFSFVETIVAFVIVALAATAITLLGTISVRASSEAQARFFALQQAEFLLWQALEGDPSALASSGTFSDENWSWSRTIQPLSVNPDILKVEVSVNWQVGSRSQMTNLMTYRAGLDDDN